MRTIAMCLLLMVLCVVGAAAQDNANEAGALLSEGKFDSAIQSYQSAVAAKPNDGQLLVALGDAWIAKADSLAEAGSAAESAAAYVEAISVLDEAVTLLATPSAAYKSRGVARYGKGDFAAAVADLTLALGQTPRYADALYYRALAYEALGEDAEALEDLAALQGISRTRANKLAGEIGQ